MWTFPHTHFTDVETEAHGVISWSPATMYDGSRPMSLPCGRYEVVPHPPHPLSVKNTMKELRKCIPLFFSFEITHTGREVGSDMLQVWENPAGTHSLSCLLLSSKQARQRPLWAMRLTKI